MQAPKSKSGDFQHLILTRSILIQSLHLTREGGSRVRRPARETHKASWAGATAVVALGPRRALHRAAVPTRFMAHSSSTSSQSLMRMRLPRSLAAAALATVVACTGRSAKAKATALLPKSRSRHGHAATLPALRADRRHAAGTTRARCRATLYALAGAAVAAERSAL